MFPYKEKRQVMTGSRLTINKHLVHYNYLEDEDMILYINCKVLNCLQVDMTLGTSKVTMATIYTTRYYTSLPNYQLQDMNNNQPIISIQALKNSGLQTT